MPIDSAIPSNQPATYRLVRGGTRLGTVTPYAEQDDFPWRGGAFDPTSEFESVRLLFDDELRLLNADQMEEWTKVWEDIEKPGLKLAHFN